MKLCSSPFFSTRSGSCPRPGAAGSNGMMMNNMRRAHICQAGKRATASSSSTKQQRAPPPLPPPAAAAVDVAGDKTLVRSSSRSGRRGGPSSRRGERARGVVDPLAGVRGRFVVTDPLTGAPTLDYGCMGGGKVNWWAIDAVEGREVRFVELLLRQAAANGVARSVASDAAALSGGGVGGGGAEGEHAGLLMPPDADGPGALIGSPDGPLQGWVPRKQVQAYSPSSDKLGAKVVQQREGVVYLRCVMDADVHGTIVQTPFFQGWRRPYVATYDGVLLQRAGLLPPGEDEGAVFEVPSPLPAAEVAALLKWQATPEVEDADARRLEVYGSAGGPTFGVTERRDIDKASLDRDERGRAIYKHGTGPGTNANPSAWYEGGSGSGGGVDGKGAAPPRARRARGNNTGGARGGHEDGARQQRRQRQQEWQEQPEQQHSNDGDWGFGDDFGGGFGDDFGFGAGDPLDGGRPRRTANRRGS